MVENQKRKPGTRGSSVWTQRKVERREERICSDHTVILNRSKTAGLGIYTHVSVCKTHVQVSLKEPQNGVSTGLLTVMGQYFTGRCRASHTGRWPTACSQLPASASSLSPDVPAAGSPFPTASPTMISSLVLHQTFYSFLYSFRLAQGPATDSPHWKNREEGKNFGVTF